MRRQGTSLTVDSDIACGGHADTDERQDRLVPLQFAHARFINLDCLKLAGGEILFHVVRAAAQKQKREDADCAVYASPAGWGALPPLSAGLPECGQEGAQFRLRNRVNK
jgi:hypothetical protein